MRGSILASFRGGVDPWSSAVWMRIENGSIAHVRRIYDFTGILLQLGVLRAKPGKP
jgi:hypothetical protein